MIICLPFWKIAVYVILGVSLGAVCGLVVAALCRAAGRADRGDSIKDRREGMMMKRLLILAIVLFASQAAAAPFLVCEPYLPQEGVVKFQVTIDAAAAVDSVPAANALHHDMAAVATGAHTVKVRACNVWGCGADSAPFTFTKSIPAAPTTISIVGQ
jgi:hypothetical protein